MATYYVKTTGNDTTGDGSEGNPYASLGKAMTATVASGTIYIKSGTYNLTTTTQNANAGPVLFKSAYTVRVLGYETTAGDGCPTGDRPVVHANGNAPTYMIQLDGTGSVNHEIHHVKIDGDNQNTDGIRDALNANNIYNLSVDCVVTQCDGTNAYYGVRCVGCAAEDNDANGFDSVGICVYCRAVGNTGYGFLLNNYQSAIHCVAVDNGSYGIRVAYGGLIVNCTSHSNGGVGIFGFQTNNLVANSIATGNTTYEYDLDFWQTGTNNADYGAAARSTLYTNTVDIEQVTLSGLPYVNAPTNMELSNSADAVLCQAAGIGFPDGLKPDLGAMPLGSTTDELAAAIWGYSNRTES